MTSSIKVLNHGGVAVENAGDRLELMMTELNRLLLEIKSNFVSDEGGVDYGGIAASAVFEQYQTMTLGLRSIDLGRISQDGRKAFIINLYNCLTIHAMVEQATLPESPLKAKGLWTDYGYDIGGLTYTLDDLEHGLLRCNRPHPTKGNKLIAEGDSRLKFVMEHCDYRIHFALNCGARSCPAIKTYEETRLNQQLEQAAESFCSQEITLNRGAGLLRLSKLFQWYQSDFGSSEREFRQTLTKYVRDEEIAKALADQDGWGIDYVDYDWATNSMR